MTTIVTLINLLEEKMRNEMIQHILANGDGDEVCNIVWLHDLNNVCDIEGCTDALGVYVCKNSAGNYSMQVLLHDNGDTKHYFAELDELPVTIVDEIYQQVMNYKKSEK